MAERGGPARAPGAAPAYPRRRDLRREPSAPLYDCTGAASQRFAFDGTRIHPAGNSGLCVAFDNPLFFTPRLRLATCSTSGRQQWSYETRSFANPVGYGHSDFIGSMVY